ncbi:SRPBCC family protein [Halovivax gelatinilyticus]|uniref:SRPBCC family protein n=1 Tax=Halovivax gelatinilyticus TaxID=2961597 RepID=UPI0020CA9B5B|nr:SRPBCC family protein [Halovivax gelatinilyticus]
MPTFEHTVDVAAPVNRVFTFGIDPENWRRTTPSLTEIEVIEETDDGLRMDATYRLLGKSMDGELEMTIVEPNEHVVTTFDSPGMTGELHYHYEETDDGTRVIQRADYEFGDSLLERVIEPVAKRFNKRQFKNSLETSRELIEAEQPIEA